MKMSTKNHGGKREGAGRKPSATAWATLSLKIEPELLAAWHRAKKAIGLSGPKLLARLLATYFPE